MGKPPEAASSFKPSSQFSLILRVRIVDRPGMLGKLTSVIGKAGGSLGTIALVSSNDQTLLRDIVVNAASEAQAGKVLKAIRRLSFAEVVSVLDQTFLLHRGGKIEVQPTRPIHTREELSMIYTPGVGRVSTAIHERPEAVWDYTIKGNTVAVVTDGSAVLGLGNLGPEAALPVMEGKAVLFKAFAGINAFPICLKTQDAGEIVETVERIAPAFGGVNLEDISAPRCFEIERELRKRLEIPVMHDDQHGTAVVVLAGLLNALRLVGKRLAGVRIVVSGAGAAAVGVSRLLAKAGAGDIIVCDRGGAIYEGRGERMNPAKEWLAQWTNPGRLKGTIGAALKGADVFLGLSAPGSVTPEALKRMARNSVVFAMANPTPEVMPEQVPFARVVATGRSDYPNQINNALAFPGVFKGAMEARSRRITNEMLIAAAKAIAEAVPPASLGPRSIIPSIFDEAVCPAVARAVAEAAGGPRLSRVNGHRASAVAAGRALSGARLS